MLGTVLGHLREMYDPDIRGVWVTLLGSTYVLGQFLTTPDFTNPYYIVGVATMVFSIIISVTILVFERKS